MFRLGLHSPAGTSHDGAVFFVESRILTDIKYPITVIRQQIMVFNIYSLIVSDSETVPAVPAEIRKSSRRICDKIIIQKLHRFFIFMAIPFLIYTERFYFGFITAWNF